MNTLVISLDDIRTITRTVGLDTLMDELIRRLTTAIKQYDHRSIQIPVRQGFQYEHPTLGLLEWMPSHHHGHSVTIKMVGYHPENPKATGLPTILSSVYKFDTTTGHLVAVADATFLTALRTGVASAVASRVLANPDSRSLVLIGCGSQAVTQLHALSRLFDIETVCAYDTDMAVAHSLQQRAAFVGVGITPIGQRDLHDVLTKADIICTATSVGIGDGPVFEDGALQQWVHINAVGSDFPGKTELPASLLKRSYVCPDHHAQAVKEGECQQLDPHEIGVDLVELIQNSHEHSMVQHQRTVFDSTGWAFEDQVAMDMLIEFATDMGLGNEVALECISDDPKDPYRFMTGKANATQAPSNNPIPIHRTSP